MSLNRAVVSLAFYIALATIAVALLPAWPAFAEGLNKEEIARAEKSFYDYIEDNVKQEFQSRVMELMKEPGVGSKETLNLAISFTKTALYNKASMNAACAGEVLLSNDPTNQNNTFEKCFRKMADQMIILNKILLSYLDTLPPGRTKSCWFKARLFERELLLPPYEFLKTTNSVLLDAKVFNECVREK